MKTISILGSGWLGLPLAEHLAQQGYGIKASTRSPERFEAIKTCLATPYIVDIDNLNDDVGDFLKADILIVNITSKNIEAFITLISRIEASSITKTIFVSSTSVYSNTNAVVTESDAVEDVNSALYQIENLFLSNECFDTTVIRFAGLIGYSRHPGRFFGERNIPQPDAPVNLIHRDDCIAIIDAIVEQGIWGEVLNACADTHPSKREFYSYARQSLGIAPPGFDDPGEARYKVINNEKIKRLLGYRFKYSNLMTIFDD